MWAASGMLRGGEFARGADVSWLPHMEASGFVFRNAGGEPQDCLATLREFGLDTVRLRVFVNPSDDPVNGHCGPDAVVSMAVRARKAGFRLMVDFHYSDTWADPGHQAKPAAWANYNLAELEQAVYTHTREVLLALQERDAVPEWVQLGNEIPSGMLWPEGHTDQGGNLARLINAGARAVDSVDPRIRTIIHLDRGQDAALYRWFFDKLEAGGAQYDVIGLSYYPYWDGRDYRESIGALERNLAYLVQRYDKDVMLVEVGGKDDQPENTRKMLGAVLAAVQRVPGGRGLGVLYWEPQGAASWSRYPLSCWRADGRPTEALQAFQPQAAP